MTFLGRTAGNTASANVFGASIFDILDFSSTSKNTTARASTGLLTGSTTNLIELNSGAHFNTSAVTSLKIQDLTGNNLVTGSRFSLYGIKGA